MVSPPPPKKTDSGHVTAQFRLDIAAKFNKLPSESGPQRLVRLYRREGGEDAVLFSKCWAGRAWLSE